MKCRISRCNQLSLFSNVCPRHQQQVIDIASMITDQTPLGDLFVSFNRALRLTKSALIYTGINISIFLMGE